MKKIGIIGCGNIFKILLEYKRKGMLIPDILYAYDYEERKCNDDGVKYVDVHSLIDLSDIVVEAASIEAVRNYAKLVIEKGKDLVVMSAGALLDRNLREELEVIARSKGCRIYVPSGAIGGIDILKSVPKDSEVILITTKPARTLDANVKERTVIFEGRASEAVSKFPRSMNIAATISLALDKDIEVKIVADPNITKNVHRIVCSGSSGKIEIVVENEPSPYNPRTSLQAILSLVTLLNSITSDRRLVVGV